LVPEAGLVVQTPRLAQELGAQLEPLPQRLSVAGICKHWPVAVHVMQTPQALS
jgi:hypothetical protein